MQTNTVAQATPKPLLFARHLIGMGIVALANPLIYYSDQPAFRWLETWLMPLALALVAFGLYALIFTQRAKSGWPKNFFILAWILLVLVVVGPWINTKRAEPRQQTQEPILAPTSQAFDPSTARPVTQQPASRQNPHNQAIPEAHPNASQGFDPTTAKPVASQPYKTPPPEITPDHPHYKAILSAHPDAFQIALSQPFQTWAKANPALQWIVEEGTADQIIRLLDLYKATDAVATNQKQVTPKIASPSGNVDKTLPTLSNWGNRSWDEPNKGR